MGLQAGGHPLATPYIDRLSHHIVSYWQTHSKKRLGEGERRAIFMGCQKLAGQLFHNQDGSYFETAKRSTTLFKQDLKLVALLWLHRDRFKRILETRSTTRPIAPQNLSRAERTRIAALSSGLGLYFAKEGKPSPDMVHDLMEIGWLIAAAKIRPDELLMRRIWRALSPTPVRAGTRPPRPSAPAPTQAVPPLKQTVSPPPPQQATIPHHHTDSVLPAKNPLYPDMSALDAALQTLIQRPDTHHFSPPETVMTLGELESLNKDSSAQSKRFRCYLNYRDPQKPGPRYLFIYSIQVVDAQFDPTQSLLKLAITLSSGRRLLMAISTRYFNSANGQMQLCDVDFITPRKGITLLSVRLPDDLQDHWILRLLGYIDWKLKMANPRIPKQVTLAQLFRSENRSQHYMGRR